MSETETKTAEHTQPTPAPLQETINPPYVVPYGHADAPPPVPPEPIVDPETQAYLEAHQASQDPREPDAPPMTPDEYHAAFAKPPDPRDTGTEDPAPGDLTPPSPGADADVATAPPVNVDVPHLMQDGAILTCTMGNWEGEPDRYEYLWVADGLEVGRPGTSEYTLVTDDVGRDYVCEVTASNAAGATTAPPSNNVTVVDFAAREVEEPEHKTRNRSHRAKEAD